MPLVTRTCKTYAVILSSDSEGPEDQKRPEFIMKYMTYGQWEELIELKDRFDSCGTEKEMLAMAETAVKAALFGWRNMIDSETGKEIEYNPEILRDLVAMPELIELMQLAVGQNMGVEDKKK